VRLFLLSIALLLSQLLFGQKTGTVSGKIVDTEQKALEKATVSVMNPVDSALISYTMADDKGEFKLYKLPLSQTLRLIVSYAGMETYEQDLTLSGDAIRELEPIVLLPRELNAVVIEAQAPVRFNGDSLEYNTNFFKTLPNATVEDLLKKLPGLQVNMDGTILYQGKEVSKVLVNKKEFFSQDLRIATRNLDADMVETVQVYRDRGDSKKKVDDESQLPVTINLKFKKELAKADFGKFYGSGGTSDRYESGALINAFRDTLQVSFIGYGNNINKQSFDYSELRTHAGLGRAENYGFNNFGGQNYDGVQNDMSAGLNVNYDWGDRTKLNILYQYTFGDALHEGLYENETFYETERQSGTSVDSRTRKNHRNSVSGKFEHRFDTTAHLRIRPSMYINRSDESSQSSSNGFGVSGPINQSANRSDFDRAELNFRNELYIEKAFTKKWILSLNNTIRYSNEDRYTLDDDANIVYAESSAPVIRILEGNTDNSDFSTTLRANMQHVVSEKLRLDAFGDMNFSRVEVDEEILQGSEQIPMGPRDDSENDFAMAARDLALGSSLSWTISKDYTVKGGLTASSNRIAYNYFGVLPDRHSTRLFWLPSLNVRLKNFSVNYSRNLQHPQRYSIRVVDNTLNYMGVTRAFPFTRTMKSDELNFNFSKYSDNYRTQFYTYGFISRQNYSIGYATNRDLSTGRYEISSFEAPATANYNVGVNYSRQFVIAKDWQIRMRNNLFAHAYENYQTENGVENKNSTVSGTLDNELTFSWKERIAISPKYTFSQQWNFVSADDPNFRDRKSSTHSLTAGLSVTSIRNFTLETSYSRVMQNGNFGENVNMNLVNMSLYYDMKKWGQWKLSVFDLLNENQNIRYYSYNNSNNYSRRNTLKQYFLLGYIYKFNRTQLKN
jgi:hypothetical protein